MFSASIKIILLYYSQITLFSYENWKRPKKLELAQVSERVFSFKISQRIEILPFDPICSNRVDSSKKVSTIVFKKREIRSSFFFEIRKLKFQTLFQLSVGHVFIADVVDCFRKLKELVGFVAVAPVNTALVINEAESIKVWYLAIFARETCI